MKAAFALDWFAPSIDTIGAALPTAVVAIDPILATGRRLVHENRAVGEPPPRLALVISRRLRI